MVVVEVAPKGSPRKMEPAPPRPMLSVGCSTLSGTRPVNNDAVAVKAIESATLCLLGDGRGFHGPQACERAFETIHHELAESLPLAGTAEQAREMVRVALVHANEDLIVHARQHGISALEATIAVTLTHPKFGTFAAGVGDSRVYRVAGNAIEQLTTDHTAAQSLVDEKKISPEDARSHPLKHVLAKYLGVMNAGDRFDVRPITLRPGDRILMCSDGFHAFVDGAKMREVVSQERDLQKCADALCRLALDNGSRDNVSCLVAELSER